MHCTILIFETSEGFAARTEPTQRDRYWAGTLEFLATLRNAGIFRGGAGLERPEAARSLRVPAGQADWTSSAGPVPSATEQLGGYFIIEVPTIEDALGWAARFPRRPGAAIEVRPNLPEDR